MRHWAAHGEYCRLLHIFDAAEWQGLPIHTPLPSGFLILADSRHINLNNAASAAEEQYAAGTFANRDGAGAAIAPSVAAMRRIMTAHTLRAAFSTRDAARISAGGQSVSLLTDVLCLRIESAFFNNIMLFGEDGHYGIDGALFGIRLVRRQRGKRIAAEFFAVDNGACSQDMQRVHLPTEMARGSYRSARGRNAPQNDRALLACGFLNKRRCAYRLRAAKACRS